MHMCEWQEISQHSLVPGDPADMPRRTERGTYAAKNLGEQKGENEVTQRVSWQWRSGRCPVRQGSETKCPEGFPRSLL